MPHCIYILSKYRLIVPCIFISQVNSLVNSLHTMAYLSIITHHQFSCKVIVVSCQFLAVVVFLFLDLVPSHLPVSLQTS